MLKPYKVELFSNLIVETNVATAEQASKLYFQGMENGFYHRGRVVNNETGEIICSFSTKKTENGIEFSQWVATE